MKPGAPTNFPNAVREIRPVHGCRIGCGAKGFDMSDDPSRTGSYQALNVLSSWGPWLMLAACLKGPTRAIRTQRAKAHRDAKAVEGLCVAVGSILRALIKGEMMSIETTLQAW
jgi:hypothetical protein